MKVSNYKLYTSKNKINNNYTLSHKLMIKSGLIKKISSGSYIWLPTGLRVIKKINSIIEKKMESVNFNEISIPILQDSELWKLSDRLNIYGNEIFHIKNEKYILSPTNEEIITYILSKETTSYKELPIKLFQINNKFRNEIRFSNGVIRTKEFIMKDAYSFHIDINSLNETYYRIYNLYKNIFNKFKLKFNIYKVKSKNMGGDISHEFKTNFNKESDIEIAHIFKIGDKYSKIFNFNFIDKLGNKKYINMGSYGIGISRLIYTIVEQNNDSKGIIWPKSISPFDICIIPINFYKSKIVNEISKKIFYKIKKINIFDIIIYDINKSIGYMFSDIELIGIPLILIINEKNTLNNLIEIKIRKNNESKLINLKYIFNYIKCFFKKN
ncbi:proline--tRNA ligase [endosymbiont of Sipalinus gigas]|uniref:aminoacyl--tRNA ligase-related protein n=1 Tax=endosymbiont of Sipalinus gigas TaxID=1972134 RepID=UPI000DC6DD57|nr:aminoacyl--tRNA ligase-related protein [endosymbiont of Sipalinus gigas]BBA85382.1 proline--tRNA ligase [endosymbiont of Sipalinus gigas]